MADKREVFFEWSDQHCYAGPEGQLKIRIEGVAIKWNVKEILRHEVEKMIEDAYLQGWKDRGAPLEQKERPLACD